MLNIQWDGLLSFVCVLFLIGLGLGVSQPQLLLGVLLNPWVVLIICNFFDCGVHALCTPCSSFLIHSVYYLSKKKNIEMRKALVHRMYIQTFLNNYTEKKALKEREPIKSTIE